MKTIKNKISNRVKLALLLWLCILDIHVPTSLMAQNGPTIRIEESGTDKTFSQRMTDLILPLDKSVICTGLLADKAFPFVSLASYDGQTDSLITTGQWKQLYRQMYLSSVSSINPLFSPEQLKQISQDMTDQSIIPIALMNLKSTLSYFSIK